MRTFPPYAVRAWGSFAVAAPPTWRAGSGLSWFSAAAFRSRQCGHSIAHPEDHECAGRVRLVHGHLQYVGVTSRATHDPRRTRDHSRKGVGRAKFFLLIVRPDVRTLFHVCESWKSVGRIGNSGPFIASERLIPLMPEALYLAVRRRRTEAGNFSVGVCGWVEASRRSRRWSLL
jgi:hypothetical protein